SLRHTAAQEVPLRDELDFLERYLSIMRVRFGDRLVIEVDAPPEVHEAMVPSLVLQPLAENAIRHGMADRADRGGVAIRAQREGESLRLAVAGERVRTLVAGAEGVALVGECTGGREAVVAIERHQPGLVFLDVQMPDLDGFEVLEAVEPEHLPTIVFVTAYDEYALRAFEVHALDYLLKPIEPERFARALARAVDALRAAPGGDRRLLALLDAL